MPQEITQEGTFRGRIVQYGLQEAKSGAVAAWIKVAVDEVYDNGEWGDWREYQVEAEGYIWIVGKDGELNKKACESLVRNAGWDGRFEAIEDQEWNPTPIGISVKADTYEGNTRYRIAFVNHFESTPGGGLGADAVKKLSARYSSQLRALAGSSKQNATPPSNGGPSKPPAPAKAEEPAQTSIPDEEIPF